MNRTRTPLELPRTRSPRANLRGGRTRPGRTDPWPTLLNRRKRTTKSPPIPTPRRPGWKGVEIQSTINSLTREVETLKAALEKAQQIRHKDPPTTTRTRPTLTRSTTTSTRGITSLLPQSGGSNQRRPHRSLRCWEARRARRESQQTQVLR